MLLNIKLIFLSQLLYVYVIITIGFSQEQYNNPCMSSVTVRRRNTPQVDDVKLVTKKIPSKLAKADIFSKPKEDYSREQTPLGSIVSAITIIIIIVLLLSESVDYVLGRSAYRTELSIAESNGGHMMMHLDIDFPLTPCPKLKVDLADFSGTLRRNVTHSLHKIPLDSEGSVAFKGNGIFYDLFPGEAAYNPAEDPESPEYCGRCIIEGDEKHFPSSLALNCCATCEAVENFYKQNGKVFSRAEMNKTPQCLFRISQNSPGCKVQGSIRLKKVRGALVFGPKNINGGNTFSISDVFQFNPSHRINALSFGDPHPEKFSRFALPSLVGKGYQQQNYIVDIKYMLSIIPTEYSMGSQKIKDVASFEYSFKWKARVLNGFSQAVPSISFYFDIFPIKVSNIFEREPFVHFIVRICGIVGGVFVTLGIVDDIVHRFGPTK